MEQPVRLVCPQCNLVYRLKRYRPGGRYTCKTCGTALVFKDDPPPADPAESPAAPTQSAPQPPRFTFIPASPAPDLGPALEKIDALAAQITDLAHRVNAPAAVEPAAQPLPPAEVDFAPVLEKIDSLAARLDTLDAAARASQPADPAAELARDESLQKLASEVREASAQIEKLREWRGLLPVQVADEIGRTVEDHVVGPISAALSRQAPAILAGLQDSKLVDIVSRSVREAQRPLLREILTAGHNGIPIWLFAATLLPLLLILGYLFIPGDTIVEQTGLAMESVSDRLERMESAGLPLRADQTDKLNNIEEAVNNIREEAMAHVRNSVSLADEVKSLRALLTERNAQLKAFNDRVQLQARQIRLYESHLIRLGVPPDSLREGE